MAEATPFSFAPKSPAGPRGLKVLVVDPNPVNRVRLKETLRGVRMVDSINEIAGVGQVTPFLAQTKVSVIMIDQHAGEEDIFTVVAEIKQHPAAADVNFLLMTEKPDKELQAKAEMEGIHGFLSRPFDINALETSLRAAVQSQAKAAKPAQPPKQVPDALKETLARLRKVALFSKFSDEELVRLLRICKSQKLAAGEFAFHEGMEGDSLFVVVSGQVDMVLESDGLPRVLVSMQPGDCFGEMAIIDSAPRSAGAKAAVESTVIQVSASIINNNDDVISLKLVRQIAILLTKKLREQSK